MSGADELYPPAQYGAQWILLAIGVLLLVAAAAWLVVALTRPRRSLAAAGHPSAPTFVDVAAVLREEYLAQIAGIEDDYRSGHRDARRTHLDLSRTVRSFVNEYSGVEAPVLALDDLVRLGVRPALIEAIGRTYYPSVFRRGTPLDPAVGIAAARQVVTTWY
ncbi:hypothetical protein [uncultured Microbacterium sp.]|uniref:hypothetical protein n=1 Tax=uncultured Microbacterium sp. TaxID=191216 RepID=UPI0025FCBBE0|nr:hypothetical protein [uncultured Microbacterium sp.]